jgi:hypothetical protein
MDEKIITTTENKKNILQYFGICFLFIFLNISFIGSIGNTIYGGLFFCFSGCDIEKNTLILGVFLNLSLIALLVYINFCFYNFIKLFKNEKQLKDISLKNKIKIIFSKTSKEPKSKKEKILILIKIVFFMSILRLLPFSVYMIAIYNIVDKKIKLFSLIFFSVIYFKIASSFIAGIGLLTNHLSMMNGNIQLGKNIFELSLKSDIIQNIFNLYQLPIILIAIYAINVFNQKKYIRSLWMGCLSVTLALSLWNYNKNVLHTDKYQKEINKMITQSHNKEVKK